MFKCEITNKELKAIRKEPVKIFVRIYGQHANKNLNANTTMVNDIIVTSVLSDFNFGPKLYGVFPSGRLEELIQVGILCSHTDFNVYKIVDNFEGISYLNLHKRVHLLKRVICSNRKLTFKLQDC